MVRSLICAGDVIPFPVSARDADAIEEELAGLYDTVDRCRREVSEIVNFYSKWGVRSSTALSELAEDAMHVTADAEMVTDLEDQIDAAVALIADLKAALRDL